MSAKPLHQRPTFRHFHKFIEVDARDADDRFIDFEIDLSRAALRCRSNWFEALTMLGHALTRGGNHKQALSIDLKLAKLRPGDAIVFYNLACSLSNLDRVDESLEALQQSLDLGYKDFSYMLGDPDLENIRRDPRFKRMLERKTGKRQP